MENLTTNAGIYQKIYAVMAELGWVEKDGQVSMGGRGGYAYATEANFIAAVRPLMVKHGLVMLPTNVEKNIDVITSDGRTTFASSVLVTYRLIDVETGDGIDVQMVGTGNDNGDKSIYKALTGAFKYALRQIFMIGTGDDPEASDEDGNSTGTVTSPLMMSSEYYRKTTGDKFTKEMITEIKNLGYVIGSGFSIDEQKTAKFIREVANKVKSGKSFADAISVK